MNIINNILNNALALTVLLALFDVLFHGYFHQKKHWFQGWLFWELPNGWIPVYRVLEWSLNVWAVYHIYTINPVHFYLMVGAFLLMFKDVVYVIVTGETKNYIEFEQHTELRPKWLNYGLGYFLFSAGYNFKIDTFFRAGFIGLILLIISNLI